ncbi:MAG: hypothetical protein XXXJIFNMEKO3_01922 [Candidatus Erwinia impunctatus]|nr:hypothetical protein XXXJIFNMEKO_01922 [Culicoides impunctatus]
MNKPVIFSDLDDTLFQTCRKMVDELSQQPYRTAALDRSLQPRSFMNREQALFVDWLLAQSELIPVTARGTEEIARVTIPFHSWAITTHGAVILTPEGQPDAEWQTHMLHALQPYREKLNARQQHIDAEIKARGINAWARINVEYDGTPVYLVMKHRDSTKLAELYALADDVASGFTNAGFYLHRNSNNVAWIPDPVEKGLAVNWLLKKLRAERGQFPVVGFGDSLSDYRFMKLCDWFAIPRQSQFATAVSQAILGDQ